MPNLHTHYHFKLDFQNRGQTYKRQAHDTKQRKDNKLRSLELPL